MANWMCSYLDDMHKWNKWFLPREKLSSVSDLRKHQNTENGKGLIAPRSFAVPIILEDSCVLAFVNTILAPLLAHIFLSHRAYRDVSKWSIVLPLSRIEIYQFHRSWAAVNKKRVERVWGDKPRHAVSSVSVCLCLRTKKIHFHYSGKM